MSPNPRSRRLTPWVAMSARPLVALIALATLVGCRSAPVAAVPDYSRPLPPGRSALRLLTDPAMLPDLAPAFDSRDSSLDTALGRSLAWFDMPSSRNFFPFEGLTHPHARASVAAFRSILRSSTTAREFQRRIREEFDTFISVGWDDSGTVLFTGYYSPIFPASRVPTGEFRYPLYARPADLLSDPVTGRVRGRRLADGRTVPYPDRQTIDADPAALGLAGTELVWLRDKLEAYLVHVQGSAMLRLPDGSTMLIGFAGTNGRDYVSVSRQLAADGKIDKNRLSLPAVREYFARHPGDLDHYLAVNPRYIFFREYDPALWPAGSLGVTVTPARSLATDKTVFPRAGVVLVDTLAAGPAGDARRPFSQLLVDQDTGGAIRAPGRADIYFGSGPDAEALAGRQYAEGRMYYFFLRPDRLRSWLDR